MADTSPDTRRSPLPWIAAVLVAGLLAAFGLTQWLGGDEPDPAPGGATTTADAPGTTPAPTDPETGATTTPTTVPSTDPPPTTSPATSAPETDTGDRAIAQQGIDIVWVDPATGDTEVALANMFEAAWATDMNLGPDSSRLYYHLVGEDNWFSCESVTGDMVAVDLETGELQTIDQGFGSLSPGGRLLAYLTTDECYPDPDMPEFFLPRYDTLVVAEPDGSELRRYPLTGTDGEAAPLTRLVWADQETVLVADEAGTHYRVPVTADEGTPISSHPRVEVGDRVVYAVVDGRALAAETDGNGVAGPLQVVDLDAGEMRPVETSVRGPYAVGVSEAGEVIVSAADGADDPRLLVGVDLETGEVESVVQAPVFNAIDW